MTLDSGNDFENLPNKWVPETETIDGFTVTRARSLAHATLVQTSVKVANIRAAAQSTLLDAHTQAEEVLAAARLDAEHIRRNAEIEAEAERMQVLETAARNADQITDRALDERDMLLTSTLEFIAELSTNVSTIADRMVSEAKNPAAARAQLGEFMVALTDMAEKVNGVESLDSAMPVLAGAAL